MGIEGILKIITLIIALIAVGIVLEVKKRGGGRFRVWKFLFLAVIVLGIKVVFGALNHLEDLAIGRLLEEFFGLLFILILIIEIWKLKI